MDKQTLAGLMNPVRIQIVLHFVRHESATTKDLAEVLPDIPQASLYRHVKYLADHGVLAVADTTPVRGAVEKRYTLRVNPYAQIEQMAQSGKAEDLLMIFYQFVMTQLLEFGNYVSTGPRDLAEDLVGFRTYPLYLSQDEAKGFVGEFAALLQRYMGKKAEDGRNLRSFSFIFMPAADSAGTEGDQ